MGRNVERDREKTQEGRIAPARPKSEKYQPETASSKRTQPLSNNLLKKNLDDYIFSLSNFELKQKLESCPGKLGECPLLNGLRKELKKTISNHLNVTLKNDSRLCKTSRTCNGGRDGDNETSNAGREVTRMFNPPSSESFKKKVVAGKDDKATCSNVPKAVIRSTRAQDLRSQSNRDLVRPKTVVEKTRTTSPYVSALSVKKKKCSGNGNSETRLGNRLNNAKPARQESGSEKKTEKKKQTKSAYAPEKSFRLSKTKPEKVKPSADTDSAALQRQRTQEVINPKIVKNASSSLSGTKLDVGDNERLQLKKSKTFFICKGTKNGEEGTRFWRKTKDDCDDVAAESASDDSFTDEEVSSPKLIPLTHNDSFCLIAKSSQQWSQKNRSDDEKLLQYNMICEEKPAKPTDKGILKNGNRNLKSVDSLEKVDSEKIVRFSDETFKNNKKVLQKGVRRKKRMQNLLAPTWYQRHKLFQKYLQILREKSVLLSDKVEIPDDLKPFRVPIRIKEGYEAEMFGLLHPRKEKSFKNLIKDSYSY